VLLELASADDDAEFAPYGTGRVEQRPYPRIDTVFDVSYEEPKQLYLLHGFVVSTARQLRGRIVVVTHGPELRVFAKENFERYQGVVQKMAELAEAGVEFRMCGEALRVAGYEPRDMHGFITVVPNGFAEIALLQAQGYRYLNPVPLSVRDARQLERARRPG